MDKHEAITKLLHHKASLKQLGVNHVALFGSAARSEQNEFSDIDLAVRLDNRRKLGLLALVEIELKISSLLGAKVDLVTEPGAGSRISKEIQRDRINVF